AVPRRLNAALRRGLDPDPTRRFESMAALLRALDYRRRRRQAAIGGGVVAIACVGALVGARLVSPRCDGGEALVAAAWNEEVERDITSKFATPGDERAAEAVARATKRLGEYASTWAKVHRDVCEATDKHRYQTEGDRATRMRCLDQRLHELKAVTDEAIAGRTASAADLVYAAASLALSQPCAKATAYPQPPPEAEERVRAVEQLIAESVAAELSSGVNGEGAGYQRAMELATQAVERAQTIGYAPLLAQALTRRARMQWLTEDDKGGIESLQDALDLTAEIEAVDIEADASTLLVKIAALGTRDDVRGEVWARQAQRVVQRLADDPLREAELLNNRGLLRMLVRDYPGAIQLHKQALELREAVPNAIFECADSHLNLGAALGAARKHREAIEHYEQGIALQRDPIGADHPRIAVDSYNTALELIHLGEYQEALSWLDRVESVYRATYGPNSLKLVRLHQARADTLDGTGQTERALAELERAQAILEASDEVDLYEFALVLRSKGHVQQ
ncbi:MAG: tetratricopeptide repeat protein, partial [Myxococcales bacterium]|nr:tetratricopeptide repeat protein [Myxococcales bacterium]